MVLPVVAAGDAALRIDLQAGELGVEDEVDHAGDRVGAVGAEAPPVTVSTLVIIASGNRLMSTPPNALVDGEAAAVEQRQRAVDAEAAQVEVP